MKRSDRKEWISAEQNRLRFQNRPKIYDSDSDYGKTDFQGQLSDSDDSDSD